MAKKENLDRLAVWLTPNAIRQHVVFHYDEDNRIRNWVNQASDDELKEIGESILGSESIWELYREEIAGAVEWEIDEAVRQTEALF